MCALLACRWSKRLAAGGEHSLAITTDGRVFAWGDNAYGQLGAGDTGSAVSLSPVAVIGLLN